MTAYVIAQVSVSDPEGYSEYAGQTIAVAEKFGGKFLAKGGASEQIEGVGKDRNVIIAFADTAAAKAFYSSEEYQAILPIAQRCSVRDLVIVEGV
ncbi:MAG: DUF1330 domain-containing protein [Rhodobacteraceae bacterium]|nr:DUF1330 domain-containing protein [Paracoccaceae bacterium]